VPRNNASERRTAHEALAAVNPILPPERSETMTATNFGPTIFNK
jgi:hypothetical protein